MITRRPKRPSFAELDKKLKKVKLPPKKVRQKFDAPKNAPEFTTYVLEITAEKYAKDSAFKDSELPCIHCTKSETCWRSITKWDYAITAPIYGITQILTNGCSQFESSTPETAEEVLVSTRFWPFPAKTNSIQS